MCDRAINDFIGFSGVVTTPKQTQNLDELLGNGVFTFPGDTEPASSYFLAAGRSGNILGDLREQAVTNLVGGTLAKDSNGQDIKVFESGASEAVAIDVFGPNGELILVGGPNKAANLPKLKGTLKNLKIIAEARGVKAQYYFTDNTPDEVIKTAEERLGVENVKIFPEVTMP